MSKKNNLTVYLDCDDTILYSSEAVIRILNKKYGVNKTIEDLKDWGYRSIVPQISQKEILDIYESKEFWEETDFNEEFKKLYKKLLRKRFDWKIVTRGTANNLKLKKKFLRKVLKHADYQGIEITEANQEDLSKTVVDMSDGIQIDDNMNCLANSSAAVRILLQVRPLTWNVPAPCEDNLYVVHNWKELADLLIFFDEHQEFVKRCY